MQGLAVTAAAHTRRLGWRFAETRHSRALKLFGRRLMSLATCIGCGCDGLDACWDDNTEQPCHWARVDYEVG